MSRGRALPAPRPSHARVCTIPGKSREPFPTLGVFPGSQGQTLLPGLSGGLWGRPSPGWLPRGRNWHFPQHRFPLERAAGAPQLLEFPGNHALLLEKPFSCIARKSRGGKGRHKAGSGDAAGPLPWLREGEVGTPLAPPPAFGDLPGANGKVGLCSQGFRQVYNLFLSRQAQEQTFEPNAVNSRSCRQVWAGREGGGYRGQRGRPRAAPLPEEL